MFWEMKLFGFKIKNFLIFLQKQTFPIFQKMKLSSPKIKKFQKNLTLKKFLCFLEKDFSSLKSYISGGTSKTPKTKISYTSS